MSTFPVRDALWRNAAKISALGEHESWVESLERDVKLAEERLEGLLRERQGQLERIEVFAQTAASDEHSTDWLRHLGDVRWSKLRHSAEKLQHAFRNTKALRQKLRQEHTRAQNRRRDLELALASAQEAGGSVQQNRDGQALIAAVESAGRRVSELRHRVQLDERLLKLELTKSELQQQSIEFMHRQILPPWTLLAIGAVFVFGVVLILTGLLLPRSFVGSMGWPLAWLGILGTAAAVVTKWAIERSHVRQLETISKQLAMTETQIAEAQEDRDGFDRAQTKGRGTPAAMLQAAEEALAKLEKLLPLEGQRQSAAQEVNSTAEQIRDAMRPYRKAKRRWRAALSQASMPGSLTPRQVQQILHAHRHHRMIDRKITAVRAELDHTQRELNAISGRVEQAFRDVQIIPASAQLSDRIRQLRSELVDEENRRKQRDALRRRERSLRVRRRKAAGQLMQLKRRRRRLLKQCGAIDLADFRRKAQEYSQIGNLKRERDTVAAEIAAGLNGIASESVVAGLLSERSLQQLHEDHTTAKRHWEEAASQLRRLLEQRGVRNEQIRLLAEDRQGAATRFELAQTECQLSAAVDRWKVLTMTRRLMTQVKEDYERNRQPETLREASDYFARLTGGRYRRVWTRFGENTLLVDDRHRSTLPIEVLSHGTREQLFLSLRMALVSLFARRGASLPLILDDVLVNFDHERAIAAVEVLSSFAQRGHQLLMFTCHEHLARLLKSRGVDVRCLPDSVNGGHDRPFEGEDEPPPRRVRLKRAKEIAPEVSDVIIAAPEPSIVPSKSAPEAMAPLPLADLPEPINREVIAPAVVVDQTPPQPIVAAQQLRIDPPQQAVRYSPILRRWAAEEFRGELDDQINPFWNRPAPVAAEPASMQPTSVILHANRSPAMAAAKAKMLRLFDGDSTAVLEDTTPGVEDWDL